MSLEAGNAVKWDVSQVLSKIVKQQPSSWAAACARRANKLVAELEQMAVWIFGWWSSFRAPCLQAQSEKETRRSPGPLGNESHLKLLGNVLENGFPFSDPVNTLSVFLKLEFPPYQKFQSVYDECANSRSLARTDLITKFQACVPPPAFYGECSRLLC